MCNANTKVASVGKRLILLGRISANACLNDDEGDSFLWKCVYTMARVKCPLLYLCSDQTSMEFPWQVTAEREKPPVSRRMLTTSVGYMKGFRQIWRPEASGSQVSSTCPWALLTTFVVLEKGQKCTLYGNLAGNTTKFVVCTCLWCSLTSPR